MTKSNVPLSILKKMLEHWGIVADIKVDNSKMWWSTHTFCRQGLPCPAPDCEEGRAAAELEAVRNVSLVLGGKNNSHYIRMEGLSKFNCGFYLPHLWGMWAWWLGGKINSHYIRTEDFHCCVLQEKDLEMRIKKTGPSVNNANDLLGQLFLVWWMWAWLAGKINSHYVLMRVPGDFHC